MKCMAGKDSVLVCDPVMTDSARKSAEFINEGGYGDIRIDVIRQ